MNHENQARSRKFKTMEIWSYMVVNTLKTYRILIGQEETLMFWLDLQLFPQSRL